MLVYVNFVYHIFICMLVPRFVFPLLLKCLLNGRRDRGSYGFPLHIHRFVFPPFAQMFVKRKEGSGFLRFSVTYSLLNMGSNVCYVFVSPNGAEFAVIFIYVYIDCVFPIPYPLRAAAWNCSVFVGFCYP